MITTLSIAVIALSALLLIALLQKNRLARRIVDQQSEHENRMMGLNARIADADKWLRAANHRVEELARYQDIIDAEYAAKKIVALADNSANDIRSRANGLLESAKSEASELIRDAQQVMSRMKGEYDNSINKALAEAERIIQRADNVARKMTLEAYGPALN